MTGRPKSKNPMKHTAVVLPPWLLDKLKEAADLNGWGLSGEIRARLIASFEPPIKEPRRRWFQILG